MCCTGLPEEVVDMAVDADRAGDQDPTNIPTRIPGSVYFNFWQINSVYVFRPQSTAAAIDLAQCDKLENPNAICVASATFRTIDGRFGSYSWNVCLAKLN